MRTDRAMMQKGTAVSRHGSVEKVSGGQIVSRPSLRCMLLGFGGDAEARYKAHVSSSTLELTFGFTMLMVVSLLILCVRQPLDRQPHPLAQDKLLYPPSPPLLYLGSCVPVLLLLLFKPVVFVKYREEIWLARAAARAASLFLVVCGWHFSGATTRGFSSTTLWSTTQCLHGTVEQVPLRYLTLISIVHVWGVTYFLTAVQQADSPMAALPRALWLTGMYSFSMVARDYHMRYMWLRSNRHSYQGGVQTMSTRTIQDTARSSYQAVGCDAGMSLSPPSSCLKGTTAAAPAGGKSGEVTWPMMGAVEVVAGEIKATAPLRAATAAAAADASPACAAFSPGAAGVTCEPATTSTAVHVPTPAIADPATSDSAKPASGAKAQLLQVLAARQAADQLSSTLAPFGWDLPPPSLSSTVHAEVFTAAQHRNGGANGSSLPSPAAAAAMSDMVAGRAVVPAGRSSGSVGGGRSRAGVAYVRRHVAHTSARVKISGLSLGDVKGDAAAQLAARLLASGQLVVGMSMREGCIELVINTLALQPSTHHLLRQLSASDLMQAIATMDLPFESNEVCVQLGCGAHATNFKHNRDRLEWLPEPGPEPGADGEGQQCIATATRWLATPIAVAGASISNSRFVGSATADLHLHLHMEPGSSPMQASLLLARMNNSFLEVVPTDCGDCMDCAAPSSESPGALHASMVAVKVPSGDGFRSGHCTDALLQLDVRRSGCKSGLLASSCSVLLLEDSAAAAELVQQLQPLMLECLADGDVHALKDYGNFVADFGFWLQYVAQHKAESTKPYVTHIDALGEQQAEMHRLYVQQMRGTAQELLCFVTQQGWAHTAAVIMEGLEAVAPEAVATIAAAAKAAAAAAAVAPWTVGSPASTAADLPTAVDVPTVAAVVRRQAVAKDSASEFELPGQRESECSPASSAEAPRSLHSCEAYDGQRSSGLHIRPSGFRRSSTDQQLPWSTLFFGFPDRALEARFLASLHRARMHSLRPMALFAVLVATLEIVRCGRECGLAPAVPFMLWAGGHVSVHVLRTGRLDVYNAYPLLWPVLTWLVQSASPLFMAAGIVRPGMVQLLTRSKYGWVVGHIARLGLPMFFVQVPLPMAIVMYSVTSSLMGFMRLRLCPNVSMQALFMRELAAWLVAVMGTAVQEYQGRLALLRSVAPQQKKVP